MFRTPGTPRKTRSQRTQRGAKPEQSVVDSEIKTCKTANSSNSEHQLQLETKTTNKSAASSTSARRRQLELEAEAAKAKLKIEAAEATAEAARIKADVQTQLLERKLAADVADLKSTSKRSDRSNATSVTDKVNKWLDKSKEHISEPVPAPDHAMQTQIDAKLLASALRDAVTDVTASQNQELLSRLATSKDLPLYFGDPMEWLQFKEAYLESTALCKYSDAENVWRLRKCLRGEAKEAVIALLIGGTAPDTIMDTLELRFGKPETIMLKIISQIKKLHPLAFHNYQNDLINFAIKIKNCVTAAKALKQKDYLRCPETAGIILAKLPTVLLNKWTDFVYERRTHDTPRLELLSDFLYVEANKIAVSGVSHIHTQSRSNDQKKPEPRNPAHTILFTTKKSTSVDDDREPAVCKFCRITTHKLPNCPRFKRAMRRDRWRFARRQNLCFKCLESPHHDDPAACTAPSCNVEGCNQPHHKLLHWTKPAPEASNGAPVIKDPPGDESVNTAKLIGAPKVALKVVPLTVHGPAGAVHAHALLDDGATVSLIAADLANQLGLTGTPELMRVRSAWDGSELACESQVVNNILVSTVDKSKYTLRARKINKLNLPKQTIPNINLEKYGLGSDFNYNRFCSCECKPLLLIGQDNHHLTSPIRCYRSAQREPYVTETPLGWCVHGSLSVSDVTLLPGPYDRSSYCSNDNKTVHDIFHLCTFERKASISDAEPCYVPPVRPLDESYDRLHDEVRKSFLLDSIGVSIKPRRNPDDVRALSIVDNTAELRDGRWCVGLPWKADDQCMPDSYPNALKRLMSVQKKLSADSGYAFRYQERMQHLFTNGFARELAPADIADHIKRVWYLPHFGVDNPNKKKLRLVFDAAAKSRNYSLNDFLLQGPDLLQSLLGIMFRFRENPIGIIGDIEDMFLRIKIRDEDMHALRFLWFDGFTTRDRLPLGSNDVPAGPSPPKESHIREYVMTSLIFGANCSPFIAQYINQTKNTERFERAMPDAVAAIRMNQYMDDYIDSVSDPRTATKLIREISYINRQGGFKMRDWLSNNYDVIKDTPREILSDKAVRFNIENQPERTLGLLWFPDDDTLSFDLSLKRIPNDILNYEKKPSKRELLSIIMSIFDLQGFLSPFTIKSKIIMQEVWKLGIKWDDLINDKLYIDFKNWLEQLKSINNIRIPRWYFRSTETSETATTARATRGSETALQLHVFCDASPRAYAAVAYFRLTDNDGRVCVSFIACKHRVAPLKSVTIPRLELQGALLACRLAETIKKEHRIKPDATFYWTDSTVVLHWIRNEHRNYKVFIANRLGEIDESTNASEWNYVPTDMNLADLATKINEYNLHTDCSWFTGPSFLYRNPDRWPRPPETLQKVISNDTLEEVLTVHDTRDAPRDVPVPDPDRFSSWMRLLRCAAAVLLFIAKCRKNRTQRINLELMNKAEVLLLRHSQSQSFQREIGLLKNGNEINRDSRLRTLTPFIDSDGLLRAGGRIDAATDVDARVKNPIILDGKHRTARLIVKYYHERAAHSFNELVINELRQTYWIVNLRPTVRTVASHCLTCRIRKATAKPPRLGDLPADRLAHHQRPFTMCGLDLFGPIDVTVGRQRHKRYGVLFTCLTVRAVHIEIVPTLTADSLIMSLRRMAARRGWPNTIISDNGTNMRGADVELRKSFLEINKNSIETDALMSGVTWKFISPSSPHMGGAWERLIRTVKAALKVVLKERAPREEILITFLAEVENLVNSRPLTHVSVDPRSHETLTPNHFLLGSSSNLPVPGVFSDDDFYLRRQWRTAQRLTDLFWSRWIREILPVLIPRTKWNREGQQLKVGDLVVVVDPSSPRNCWPKGIVQKVYPGTDGRVRIVDIRTRSGVMKRPTARVALLRLDDECRSDDTRGEDVGDVKLTLLQ